MEREPVGDTLRIGPADPAEPGFRVLLEQHLAFAATQSPRDSIHALDIDGLKVPGLWFFGAWIGGQAVGCGALRELTPDHGELKSMHTARALRGQGVGSRMVSHLLAEARKRGFHRVSLETGTTEGFAPARALYRRFGFRECPPFGNYRVDPFSVCMCLELDSPAQISPLD
jgi:putative acetyltransferase